jgi:hypothetical protein
MPLVVTGRVHHRQMQPDQVHAVLCKHIPGLVVGTPDFSVDRNGCKVEFFCNTTTTLDYTVTPKSSGGPPPAAVTILAREAQSLNAAVLKGLGSRFNRAEIKYCYLEDDRSRSRLLDWLGENPLSSRPAKFSYILCAIIAIVGAVLVYLMFRQPSSDSRTDSIISLIVGVVLAMLAIPLPFFYEHFKLRGSGRWVYFQGGEGS